MKASLWSLSVPNRYQPYCRGARMMVNLDKREGSCQGNTEEVSLSLSRRAENETG